MSDPKENVGKIIKSLEKYYDVRAGEIRVKKRPALIIGFESCYANPFSLDYELLPISRINSAKVDSTYDFLIDGKLKQKLGIIETSYIRTHKITWNHIKNMDINPPICDLKNVAPDLFNRILQLNEQWIVTRTKANRILVLEDWL